jgi:hypothetical protein
MPVEEPEDCPGGTPNCAFRVTEEERRKIIATHRKRAMRYARKRRQKANQRGVKPRRGGKKLKTGDAPVETINPKDLTPEVLDGE